MTDIHEPLSRLGLDRYVEIFINEGFDSWQAILHITESDLDHLGVKLGHRRILQREIAYARGVSVEQLSSPTRTHQLEDGRANGPQDGAKSDEQLDSAPRGKRKYRRHPKNDEHAPERPPSAYVLFSNKIREELKPQNLSFTEIAKRVGERWQTITPEDKGTYEKSAMEMKENYHKEMAIYKMTENYRNHTEYLADFKLRYSNNTDGKRPKLEQEDSKDSTGSSGSQDGKDRVDHAQSGSTVGEPRPRVDSMRSTGPFQSTSGLPSPASVTGRPVGVRGGLATILPHSNVSPISTSPSSPSLRRDSSAGPMPATVLQSRPLMDSSTDPSSYSGINQRLHRHSPYGDPPSYRSNSPGPSIEPRVTHTHENQSPFDEQRQSGRPIPKLIHHDTSSSSNLSLGSSISAASTAASSIYPATRNAEESDRPQLPPLSATGLHKPSGKMADYALRPNQPPSSSGSTPPSAHQKPYQSHFNGSPSLTGMKFEFLQLPAPYNVAFGQEGQQPLPRPENEGRLSNIFDMQDIPLRASPRNLTLQQSADQHNMTVLSQVRDPRTSQLQPLQPVLPSLRPGISAIPRHSRPSDPGARPDEDRLALLADVAHADQDRRAAC